MSAYLLSAIKSLSPFPLFSSLSISAVPLPSISGVALSLSVLNFQCLVMRFPW